MNTTNKEIIEEFIKKIIQEMKVCGFGREHTEMVIKIVTLPLFEALRAKDNKHIEETREIVEGIPKVLGSLGCGDCDETVKKGIEIYQQTIKDKYNLN